MTPLLVLLSATFPIVDSVCVNLSSTVKNGFYLQNNLLGVLKKPSLFDCAAACQAHVKCLSFGFEPRKRLCHLHTKDESEASDDLVLQEQWIHRDMSALPKVGHTQIYFDIYIGENPESMEVYLLSPKELWGPCADINCTDGQKCITNRVTKRPVCVKDDFAQSEDRCPPKKKNDTSGEITEECLNAICKVESECKPPNYFHITENYYTDCKEEALENCVTTKNCSGDCVKAYMSRYGKYCTGDRSPTCKDYARIHKGGPEGCKKNFTLEYWNRVKAQLEASPCSDY